MCSDRYGVWQRVSSSLSARQEDVDHFERHPVAFKCVLVLDLISALVALGTQVGWCALLDAM